MKKHLSKIRIQFLLAVTFLQKGNAAVVDTVETYIASIKKTVKAMMIINSCT